MTYRKTGKILGKFKLFVKFNDSCAEKSAAVTSFKDGDNGPSSRDVIRYGILEYK
jgi:hypothetical protein